MASKKTHLSKPNDVLPFLSREDVCGRAMAQRASGTQTCSQWTVEEEGGWLEQDQVEKNLGGSEPNNSKDTIRNFQRDHSPSHI